MAVPLYCRKQWRRHPRRRWRLELYNTCEFFLSIPWFSGRAYPVCCSGFYALTALACVPLCYGVLLWLACPYACCSGVKWRTTLVPSLLLSRCNRTGKCVRCVCVRSRQPCVSCLPGDHDGCHNRPASRPASTTPMPPDTTSHASFLLPPTVSLSGAPATVHLTPLTPPWNECPTFTLHYLSVIHTYFSTRPQGGQGYLG